MSSNVFNSVLLIKIKLFLTSWIREEYSLAIWPISMRYSQWLLGCILSADWFQNDQQHRNPLRWKLKCRCSGLSLNPMNGISEQGQKGVFLTSSLCDSSSQWDWGPWIWVYVVHSGGFQPRVGFERLTCSQSQVRCALSAIYTPISTT